MDKAGVLLDEKVKEYGKKHQLGDHHSWRFSALVIACISCESFPTPDRTWLLTSLLALQFSPLRVHLCAHNARKLKDWSRKNHTRFIIRFCMPNDFASFWAVLRKGLLHLGAWDYENHEECTSVPSAAPVTSVIHFRMLAVMLHAMYKPESEAKVLELLEKYKHHEASWLEKFASHRLFGLPVGTSVDSSVEKKSKETAAPRAREPQRELQARWSAEDEAQSDEETNDTSWAAFLAEAHHRFALLTNREVTRVACTSPDQYENVVDQDPSPLCVGVAGRSEHRSGSVIPRQSEEPVPPWRQKKQRKY